MNILCLVIDRLRASALGAYGASWCDTPALDRLASRSFLFDQLLVDRAELAMVYRSYWQSLHALVPEAHAANLPTLPAILSEQGYSTTLITDDSLLAEHPLAADFEHCVRLSEPAATAAATDVGDTGLARFFGAAIETLETLEQQPDSPFCLWLHARGLSGPWDAPYALRSSLADPEDPQPPTQVDVPSQRLPNDYDPDELLGFVQAYFGQVLLLDQCVAALLEYFESSPLATNTLLVLTSPRGFPLGEHHRVGEFDETLHGESLHVPLLIRFPDGCGKLNRSSALVSPSDLPVTLLRLLEMEGLEDRFGRNLLPIVRGEVEEVRSCLLAASTAERAVRTPGWFLRVPDAEGASELYVQPDDRWGANEISSRMPEVAAGLQVAAEQLEQAIVSGDTSQFPQLDRALLEGPE